MRFGIPAGNVSLDEVEPDLLVLSTDLGRCDLNFSLYASLVMSMCDQSYCRTYQLLGVLDLEKHFSYKAIWCIANVHDCCFHVDD